MLHKQIVPPCGSILCSNVCIFTLFMFRNKFGYSMSTVHKKCLSFQYTLILLLRLVSRKFLFQTTVHLAPFQNLKAWFLAWSCTVTILWR